MNTTGAKSSVSVIPLKNGIQVEAAEIRNLDIGLRRSDGMKFDELNGDLLP
jgi:hypothetical protein